MDFDAILLDADRAIALVNTTLLIVFFIGCVVISAVVGTVGSWSNIMAMDVVVCGGRCVCVSAVPPAVL